MKGSSRGARYVAKQRQLPPPPPQERHEDGTADTPESGASSSPLYRRLDPMSLEALASILGVNVEELLERYESR